MKHLKRSLALLLALCMTLSLLTCIAMAEEDESKTEITVYVTYNAKDLRPGDTVDISYSIGPVKDLMRFSFTVSEPEGLDFVQLMDTLVLADRMFDGEGESGSSGRNVQAHAYYQEDAFSCDEIYYLFSARYNVPDDAEEGEVTFGWDSASFRILGAEDVQINIVTEPINIVIVDSSALERQVSSAESILGSKDLYSDHSFAALEEALADAEKILDNIHDYYQDNVDRALAALTEAYDGLKTPAQELDAAIESASQLRESDYTTDSWAAMTEALEAAKDIRDSDSATKEDINAAADALYNAINALEALPEDEALAASRKALEQLVQEVKELNESDYSESTWTALQSAITAAEEVLENDDATKEELDDAYDTLALAMSRAQLEKAVEMAKLLNESDYDADSWADLQAAIEAAEAVLNDENATKQELDDAYDALIEAMNAGNSSNTYPYSTNNGNGDTGSSGGIVTSPQTGDSNILLMSMFLLAAGMGTCAAACVSKARRAKK